MRTYYFNWRDDHFDFVAVSKSEGVQPGRQRMPDFSHLPRFDEYSVTGMFKGKPVAPILSTADERRFRTVIRRGVSEGCMVEHGATAEMMKGPGPNFAGHSIIIKWGCGSDCGEMAIVDPQTGRVYAASEPWLWFLVPDTLRMDPAFP